MGDYYFAVKHYEWRGELQKIVPKLTIEVIRSEDFATKDFEPSHLYKKVLGVGECGIWFYETALWDKTRLKEELRKLINTEVDKFFEDYDKKVNRIELHKMSKL